MESLPKCHYMVYTILLPQLRHSHSYVIATFIYGTAHIQVYKLTSVTCRASRNFACDLLVGLVRHEKYTAHERLLMN